MLGIIAGVETGRGVVSLDARDYSADWGDTLSHKCTGSIDHAAERNGSESWGGEEREG